jgi:hypothetical protein
MSEVVPSAQHEFWRPPAVQPSADAPALVGACYRCGAEFMVGARFCHVCGAARQAEEEAPAIRRWTRHLEFHNIQNWLGLRTASLIAFFIGLGCGLAALVASFIFSVHSVLEWQAVQMYRIQWLLAAIVAFAAGMLLKRKES